MSHAALCDSDHPEKTIGRTQFTPSDWLILNHVRGNARKALFR